MPALCQLYRRTVVPYETVRHQHGTWRRRDTAYLVVSDVIGRGCDVVERLVADDAVDGADARQTVGGADAVRHQSAARQPHAHTHPYCLYANFCLLYLFTYFVLSYT